MMNSMVEEKINAMLEAIAQGYANAIRDWKADKKNPFKDGRMLAYYEAKETLMKYLDAEAPLKEAFEEINRRYNTAKSEWLADKKNTFKDGKFLGYFEVLKVLPAGA